ncbi:MAG TPA: NADH-quinone oxidoreductase subunit G, partial [Thiotrichaceae bacterium]|nr:NADH-quinone oxidoreductase subunit G [Thiotrichaceae bacterium]
LQKLMRAKGISNIDHRLRQTDFTHQEEAPQFPWLGLALDELEKQDVIVLIGSDVRHEQPLANHRIRRAVMNGAKVVVINPLKTELNYSVSYEVVASPQGLVKSLAGLVAKSGEVPVELTSLKQTTNSDTDAIVALLDNADNAIILLGNLAVQMPVYDTLRALSATLAKNTSSQLGYLAESANTAGAWLAGVVPHRVAGGDVAAKEGLSTTDMLMVGLNTMVLYDIDPAYDCDNPQLAMAAMHHAKVIAFSSYASKELLEVADILLPISCAAEMSGSFINAEGRVQSFRAASATLGESKPGWRVLRVLGNRLDIDGFDYLSSSDVLAEFNKTVVIKKDNSYPIKGDYVAFDDVTQLQRISQVHAYSVDAQIRRANALQKTYTQERNRVSLNSKDIKQLSFETLDSITVKQGDSRTIMSLVADDTVPIGCVKMLSGTNKSALLGAAFGAVELQGEH